MYTDPIYPIYLEVFCDRRCTVCASMPCPTSVPQRTGLPLATEIMGKPVRKLSCGSQAAFSSTHRSRAMRQTRDGKCRTTTRQQRRCCIFPYGQKIVFSGFEIRQALRHRPVDRECEEWIRKESRSCHNLAVPARLYERQPTAGTISKYDNGIGSSLFCPPVLHCKQLGQTSHSPSRVSNAKWKNVATSSHNLDLTAPRNHTDPCLSSRPHDEWEAPALRTYGLHINRRGL